jgi:putative ABC transport system substrate-binding protein
MKGSGRSIPLALAGVSAACALAPARERGAELDVLPITTDPASVRAALDQMQRRRPDGEVLYNIASIAAQAAQLHAGIVALRLPASGSIEAGSVVRHGWNVNENLRESTEFVDRILRGASPAELPVRQLVRVEVTLDLRTAREIGIEVPASLRARAARLIE